MFTDIINKETFEFTCKTENTARQVQHDIESHTMVQLNHIIESVFSETGSDAIPLKIDRIEIDLGDIYTAEIGSNEVLSVFKNIFTQKLRDAKTNHRINLTDGINAENIFNVQVQDQNEFELIQSFMEKGDVPWWVDKSSRLNIDSIVQTLVNNNSGPFKRLLEKHKASPELLSRLFTQIKPGTYSKIKEWVSNTFITENIFSQESRSTQAPQQKINDARANDLTNLKDSIDIEGVFNVPIQNQKELELIQSLIETGNVPWWVDKNTRVNIDSIVQSLVNNNSEAFRRILEEHKASPEFLSGLLAQIKPGTLSKIKEWLPALSDTFLKERYVDENTGLGLSKLSVEHIKNLKKFFAGHTFDSHENNKYKLLNSLTRLFRSARKNQTSFESSTLKLLLRLFGMEQLISAPTNYPPSKPPVKKNKIVTSVNRLTVFEVELLLFEVARYFEQENQVRNDAEIPVEKVSPTTSSGKTSGNDPDLKTASSTEKNNTETPGNNVYADNRHNEQNTEFLKKIQEATDLGGNAKQAPYADKIENEISFLNEEKVGGHNYQFIKKIGLIMKRLKTSNPFLFQYLQKLNENQLEHLSGIFKKRIHEKREHKQTINGVLEHPFLFKYNLLDILKYLPVSKEEHTGSGLYLPKKKKLKKDKLQEIISSMESSQQSRYFSSLKKLAEKDFFIVKDILQKGRFDTESEKNIVKKILRSLSHENILLLKFLTELPIEEIEQVLPSVADKKEADRFSEDKSEDKKEKKVYIENAGLCLLAVYLPHFFNQLKYLENGKFKNIEIAARAIYILQYLVTGKTKEPEYLLQLNKLICAFQIEDPVVANIHLTKKEKLEADNLIAAVILNWKSLKNTSAKGLRESFLQRKGILSEDETSWTLRVEKKGYDLLLDAIPWSYSMIKFPWMKKMIHVEW